jgi:uncharacterized protein (DUF1697 family)
VALLRGINVVGRNRVSMSDLRGVVAGLGHTEVATYIQSGNVVFAAADRRAAATAIADALEAALAARLAVSAAVVALTRAELAAAAAQNPFEPVEDPRTLHAVFLHEAPSTGGVEAVAAALQRARAKGSRDDVRVVGRTAYLLTPDGFARSVLRAELDRGGALRTPVRTGTARNWATVTALRSLLGC